MQNSKQKIDLALILPDEEGACDACVERLLVLLRGKRGVLDAHVVGANGMSPKLCLHVDRSLVRADAIRLLVERAGAELHGDWAHVSIPLVGLRHERHAKLVEGVFAKEPGVLHATVSFGARRAFVDIDPRMTSREKVNAVAARAGVATWDEAPQAKEDPHQHQEREREQEQEHHHGGPFGEWTELVLCLLCGLFAAIGWGLSQTSLSPFASTAAYIAAYVAGGWFTVQEVAVALRARRFEIDFLMLAAAVGAAALGEWAEGALLLFLFTLGHSLEGFAMRRARNAIAALAQLAPETALRLEGTAEREVPVGELRTGDRVLVKPNTRIPADAFVLEGTSSVNQAPITGESVPVDKRPVPDEAAARARPESLSSEHRAFAGSINGTGALTLVVTKLAGDTTLARVVKLVSEAETQKSASQRFTDRFERVFVPVILGVVGLLLFAWVVVDEPFSASFYRAMAVLVAASPCALAIATPSAILSGVARAARDGVLVKGGAHLEALGSVRAIAFDKTGTLTEGKPRLTDVVPAPGSSQTELLRVALAMERRSDHPLAGAVVDGAAALLGEQPPLEASGVEAIVGFGIAGLVAGAAVEIGKPGLFERDGPIDPEVAAGVERLSSGGRTVMVVRASGRFLGVLGLMDAPRESAKEVLAALKALGIEKTIMLTGDNQRVADAVAKEVGIADARGDLLPEQKVEAIGALASSSDGVAMVGDGVNDAPAMATATVGIAMGAGGSDVALETADVALMADNLRALPFAIGLSRAARRVVRQNLWASLGMVAFLVPATVFDFAGIGVAVAFHEGSTLLVVLNALRLLAYRHPR